MADNPATVDAPIGEQVGQKIHEGTEQVKQQAQQAVQQGQALATRAWETGRGQFKALLNGKKSDFATRLEDFAKVLEQSGSQLREQGHAGSGQMAERLAERVNQATGAVRDKEIDEIIADTENFARAQPALFLSVVGLLGFVLARFLKSSGQGLAPAKA